MQPSLPVRLRFNLAEPERRARIECGPEPPIADSEARYRYGESCMRRYNSRLKRTRKEIAVLELQQKQSR